MTHSDLQRIAGKLPLSKSTLARNAQKPPTDADHHLTAPSQSNAPTGQGKAKRIRQSLKPLMNKLETEWYEILKTSYPPGWIKSQAIRFKLGNGIWYKPDFVIMCPVTGWKVYEVKGPHAFRGGFENLKVAAHQWPELTWVLVWKADGKWQSQDVLA